VLVLVIDQDEKPTIIVVERIDTQSISNGLSGKPPIGSALRRLSQLCLAGFERP